MIFVVIFEHLCLKRKKLLAWTPDILKKNFRRGRLIY